MLGCTQLSPDRPLQTPSQDAPAASSHMQLEIKWLQTFANYRLQWTSMNLKQPEHTVSAACSPQFQTWLPKILAARKATIGPPSLGMLDKLNFSAARLVQCGRRSALCGYIPWKYMEDCSDASWSMKHREALWSLQEPRWATFKCSRTWHWVLAASWNSLSDADHNLWALLLQAQVYIIVLT